MNADLARAVQSARIVTPECVAIHRVELILMRISILAAQLAETPLHIVRFEDGVVAMVACDPRNRTEWQRMLASVYKSAHKGVLGPISPDGKRR